MTQRFRALIGLLVLVLGLAFAAAGGPGAKDAARIQQSLQSAFDHVQELKNQVSQSAPNDPAQEQRIDQTAQAASHEMESALAGQDELRRLSDSDLGIRRNQDYRALNDALSLLAIDQKNLQLRIGERNFARNKSTVLKDLALTESNLTDGIRHAQGLNQALEQKARS